MSIEEHFRERIANQDQSEVMGEFGVSREQAIELQWRVARALWVGIQIGGIGATVVMLMALGAWAIWRGVSR